MITGIILLILAMVVTNFIIDRYVKLQTIKLDKEKQQIEVLKVVTKHECFGKYKDEPKNFEYWVSEFLNLKGYSNIKLNSLSSDDEAIVAFDRNGQKVYVEYSLQDPEKWENSIKISQIYKLVGTMLADGVRKGLIITTQQLSHEAKEYIEKIGEQGYKISYIEGDSLVTELFELREDNLQAVLASR